MICTHYQVIFVIFYLGLFLSFRTWTIFAISYLVIFSLLSLIFYRLILFLIVYISELELFMLSLGDNYYADKILVYKVVSYNRNCSLALLKYTLYHIQRSRSIKRLSYNYLELQRSRNMWCENEPRSNTLPNPVDHATYVKTKMQVDFWLIQPLRKVLHTGAA